MAYLKASKSIALFVTLILSNMANAVIVEGSFDGRLTEWESTNMDLTSDAQFFNDENSWNYVTGTFWYDTEQAGQPVLDGNLWGELNAAIYSGLHNWLHTTLVGANGATLDLTSSGASNTYTASPTERLIVGQSSEYDRIYLTYNDIAAPSSFRTGSLTLESEIPFLNGLGLIQDYSSGSDEDGIVGYISYENRGTLNGVTYGGWLIGEIYDFDIHVKDAVTVPEPSSLLLLCGPLMLLLWRSGVLAGQINRKR